MNPESPAVTVLIATYNKSATLRLAIESVLWQTFVDFELWVVGDGCTDDSEEVVRDFDDPRVHWYNLPQNTGDQSEPHNEGLRRARGRHIAYLNHDDIWLPDHLQVLVDKLEETGAEFAFSILEWIIPGREPYAVIPDYPDAPIPPEATVTIHRRSIVDEIGHWRRPHEVYSFPRADYFRRAQFRGMQFEFVPALTALKFGVSKKGYSVVTQQTEYLERVRSEPDFAHREAAALLARVQHELERPVTLRRWMGQLSLAIKRAMAKRKIDPARIRPWQRPGRRMKAWRKGHGLE